MSRTSSKRLPKLKLLSDEPDEETVVRRDDAPRPSAFSGVPDPHRIAPVAVTCSYLRENTELSLDLRLRIVVETLRALHGIHTDVLQSPVARHHGALSPRCILIDEEGRASLLREPGSGEPPTYEKPYSAPEVRRGFSPDQKSDIYSAGVLLYEALTSRHLGEERADSVPTPSSSGTLCRLECPLDDRLYDIALQAMLNSPEERFESVNELAEQVVAAAGSRLGARERLGEVVTRELAALQRKARTSSGIELLKRPESLVESPLPAESAVAEPLGQIANTLVGIVASTTTSAVANDVEPAASSDVAERTEVGRPMLVLASLRASSATLGWSLLALAAVGIALLLGFWLGRGSTEIVPEAAPSIEAAQGSDSSLGSRERSVVGSPTSNSQGETPTPKGASGVVLEQPAPSASAVDKTKPAKAKSKTKTKAAAVKRVRRPKSTPDPFDFGF